jgi:hypothetical protein
VDASSDEAAVPWGGLGQHQPLHGFGAMLVQEPLPLALRAAGSSRQPLGQKGGHDALPHPRHADCEARGGPVRGNGLVVIGSVVRVVAVFAEGL